MKNTEELYKEVHLYLDSRSYWDASHVAVGVKDSIVILSGRVQSYSEKKAIIGEIRKLEGVKAVIDELEVSLEGQTPQTDEALAEVILKAFEKNAVGYTDHIRVAVENGIVTLMGQVEFDYQKAKAEEIILAMEGVRRIINHIFVRPLIGMEEERNKVLKEDSETYEKILYRLNSLNLDTNDVFVEVRKGLVRLDGKVTTLAAKTVIEEEIMKIPNVKAIANELIVAPVKKAKVTDIDIAKTVLDTLCSNPSVPFDKIKISVDLGFVTLSGEVDFPFQKIEAENSIRELTGILGVINEITIKHP